MDHHTKGYLSKNKISESWLLPRHAKKEIEYNVYVKALLRPWM